MKRKRSPLRRELSTCEDCLYFEDNPKAIEVAFPGMTMLGSAYSSSRGDAGICVHRGLFLVPVEGCKDFVDKGLRLLWAGLFY